MAGSIGTNITTASKNLKYALDGSIARKEVVAGGTNQTLTTSTPACIIRDSISTSVMPFTSSNYVYSTPLVERETSALINLNDSKEMSITVTFKMSEPPYHYVTSKHNGQKYKVRN